MSRRLFAMLLSIMFLNSTAIGLVFPLFSSLFFHPESSFVEAGMSQQMRGIWLGILLSTMPMTQMIVSSFVGILSDRLGRRPIMIGCLIFGCFGYFFGAYTISCGSLYGLLLSRILVGIASSSAAIENAVIADCVAAEERGPYFAWISMAFGTGFVFGPLLGGLFSGTLLFPEESFVRPFLVTGLLLFVNTFLVSFLLPETRLVAPQKRTWFYREITSIDTPVLYLLGTGFLFCFGWSFYIEMIPVWWVARLNFSLNQVSLIFTYGSLWYVLSSGVFVSFLLRKFSPLLILQRSLLLLSFCIVLVLLVVERPLSYWVLIPIQHVLAALILPVIATTISQKSLQSQQGKAMGLYTSADALGWGVSPLIAGGCLGIHFLFPIVVSAIAMLLARMCARKSGTQAEPAYE